MAILDLLASPPGTGKTSQCIELFKKEISKTPGGIDSRSFFILPSREHADRIQSLILKKETPGVFNAHILTINEFTARCLGAVAGSSPTDAQRSAILREILEDPELSFPYLGAVSGFKGFRELFLDTVKEFKASLLEIKEFEKLAQPLLKSPAFRSKFRDFSMILKNYQLRLAEKGLREPEDDIRMLIETRQDFSAELVVFDGFYHFTRAQRSLMESVSTWASQVVVTLTMPDDAPRRELFDYSERTRKFLTGIGFKEKRKGLDKNHRAKNKALMHLEKNLFLEAPVPLAGNPEGVSVLEASSLRGEMEMIARQIKKLYRENELHYSDICVILRGIGAYEKTIDLVFRELEVPFYIHERKRLIENGFGATLHRFLNFSQENWKREDLFFTLKSSYVAQTESWDEVLEFESLSLSQNITEGRERWMALGSSADVREGVRALLNVFLEHEKKLLEAKSVEAFSEAIFSLIGHFRIDAAFVPDAQAMKAVESILKSARLFYRQSPDRHFSGISFIKEFQESLEAALFSVKPEGKNRVQIYDVVMALPKEYKVVFVAGLLEKTFPQEAVQDPFFKDEERRVLNKKGVVLEERVWRLAGERTFFYMAVTRAREQLFLSYPLYDGEGRPALASFFAEEVRKIFPGLIPLKRALDQFLPEPEEWLTESEAVRGLSEIISDGVPQVKESRRWTERPDFKEVAELKARSFEARILDPKLKKIFSDSRIFSATKLETYSACAFKYFASKMLFLNEPSEGREHLEMGNLLHETLERFYKELSKEERENPLLWKNSVSLNEKLKKILAKILEEKNPFKYEPLYRQKIYRIKVERLLDLFAEREKKLFEMRGLVPSFFELSFGDPKDGGREYLKIKEPSGEIWIEGKIDRIDLEPSEKKALVVDYKKSKRSVPLEAKFEKGLELQLPVYILFLQRALGLEAIGGELRFLQSSSEDGFYLEAAAEKLGLHHSKKTYTDTAFEAMLKLSEKRIQDAVSRLRSADIRVKSKSCEHCEFDSVCRFEKWKLIYG